MAGFFKKLFNRITGKKDEALPVEEQAALPAPVVEEGPVVEDLPAPTVVGEVAVAEPPPKAVKPKATAKALPKAEPPKPKPAKVSKKKAVPSPRLVKPVKPVAVAKKPAKQEPAPSAPIKAKAKAVTPVVRKVEEPMPVSPVVIAPPAPKPESRPEPKPEPKREPLRVVGKLVKDAAVPVVVAPEEPQKKGWLSRLKDGLSKSSKSITGSITTIFAKRKLNAETLQELEDTLIQADLGLPVAERIIKAVSHGRYDKEIDPQEVKQILAAEVAKVLKPVEVPFNFGEEKPFVVLVAGVNGSGKTTTIGKLGAIAAAEGFKVKFAACDTFRAAAIEQLTVWGKRVGAETISRPQGADAAGLAFDAMKASQEDGTDILFIDTAGRLHNKAYLMDELDKVVRVIKKYDAKAPHAVLLVLDATTGQNALAQAEAFTRVAGVTGLIMTKLDGTARGGILVAIAEKFKLPIHAIGVGESIDDLQPFDAEAFARAIAGLDET
jgi:fused signal recognition particle receptor